MPLMIFALLFFVSVSAVADSVSDPAKEPAQLKIKNESAPEYLPGEEVTRNNKTMKVWTSAGPVPVENEPEPHKSNSGKDMVPLGNLGIIVDQREDRR